MTNRIDLEADAIRESFTPPLHFYAGMKLALEEYNGPQSLEVEVLDTRLYPGEVRNLATRSSVKEADMIIGPWRSDNIKIIARVSQEEEIPFVSPIYPSNAILTENPYHIQVNPSLETHARAIIDFTAERFPVDNIVLVERKKSFLQTFQKAHKEVTQGVETDSLAELVLSDDPSEWMEEDFKDLIKPLETTVFIIPATSHSDETFVHNVLRQIDLAREEENVVVMGMPAWASYSKISYDYYEKLNVHISTAYYINRQSARIHQFRKKYYDKYGTLPLDEAYKGYDIMEYFVRMLSKHGTRFQYWLDQEPMDALHTRFEFEQIVPPDAILKEDYAQAERFENRFVQILEFEDYIFSPVK